MHIHPALFHPPARAAAAEVAMKLMSRDHLASHTGRSAGIRSPPAPNEPRLVPVSQSSSAHLCLWLADVAQTPHNGLPDEVCLSVHSFAPEATAAPPSYGWLRDAPSMPDAVLMRF